MQSPACDVVPDDRSLGPDYRGREVNFRRHLVLLLTARVLVNHAQDSRPRSSSTMSVIILTVEGSCILLRFWLQWSRIKSVPFLNR